MKCKLLMLTVLAALSGCHQATDFVSWTVLEDSEKEMRVRVGRIVALQTSVEWETGLNSTHQGLVLRQVTDGKHFIQLIYDSAWTLLDCEYLKHPEYVKKFLNKFVHDFDCVRLLGLGQRSLDCNNSTYRLLKDGDVPSDLRDLLNYRRLRSDCRQLHIAIRKEVKRHRQIDPGTYDRSKRDLFLFPGTNWCGFGNSGRKFNELGYNAATDRCCRDHDLCPYTVESFTHNYGFFNYRFHTISHCDCDERFRACLKLANTAISNLVGKLYFNIVQTKCFLFKVEDVCFKRSWWGKCMKSKKQKNAYPRDCLRY